MPKRSNRRCNNSVNDSGTTGNSNVARLIAGLLIAVAVVVFQLKDSTKAFQPYFSSDIFTLHNDQPLERRTELENPQTISSNKLLQGQIMVDALQKIQQEAVTRSNNNDNNNNNNQKKKKPLNILLLYPDDWRHDTIGGVAPVVQTPFLNKLAREGIRFTHNMVTTSICWVSRATLFTGQYVSRHKSYRLRTPEFYTNWHNESWPALLQSKANYFTGHIGKWQYANPESIVQTTLFNYSMLFEGSHSYPGGISAAERTVREMKIFLEIRPKDQPFAATAAFYPPKAIGNAFAPGGQWFPQNRTRDRYYGSNVTIPRPYNESDSYSRLPWFFHTVERGGRSRWEERFETDEQYQAAMKNYYSLVTEVDQACRDIVGELEKEGILDDTLIIFTTDNGMFLGEHGLAGKWYPYQESIRVPLIIRDPRMPQENRNTLDASLTLNIDLHATILGAAGIALPSSAQGRNMADLYLPKDSSSNDDDDEQDEPSRTTTTPPAVFTDPWRTDFFYEFPLDMGKTMPMSTAVVRKDMKYIRWPQFKYSQLFNLTEDPLELNNVRKDPDYVDIVLELKARHKELKEAVK